MSNWTLLGGGAVGGLFSGLLWHSGQGVNLLRSDEQQAVARHELALTLLDGQSLHFAPPQLGVEDAAKIEKLMVTTKAYQVQPALEPLIGRLPATTPILLLHNGMGTAVWVARAFPHNPLLLGITSNGARRLGPHHFIHTGAGETWIGAGNEAARPFTGLAQELARALPHAAWSEEIGFRQWEKLVINAIINPLTALSGEPNGSLLARSEEIEALCHELHPLLLRQGFARSDDYWFERVLEVASRTASNYSSMQQDLAAGRPTEIDYLSGYLLHQARAEGLQLPLQQQLYLAIKARESAAVTGSKVPHNSNSAQ